eukprot:SAG31_NODE_28633_length_407_cov_0.850649_2_plen_77_part_01
MHVGRSRFVSTSSEEEDEEDAGSPGGAGVGFGRQRSVSSSSEDEAPVDRVRYLGESSDEVRSYFLVFVPTIGEIQDF